ncbi:MAG: ATP-dependent 6-phosphofructokinase [Armatimonadetes bacterium]|nr:ATP-dependent 6-phosphofructokinase [Armatimonadota bacterium]
MSQIRRIAITTGGGDAPGLNAVIRAVVVSALRRGIECLGIRDGYNGLLLPEEYGEKGLIPLLRESVRGITHLGGTILGTTNRGNPLRFPVMGPDGAVRFEDRTEELVSRIHRAGIDAIVSIGGDGSMAIAHALHLKGARVVGVPKTIDNDLNGTVATFGFDTAVSFSTECIDRVHSTAQSHQRVMIVEVMGRYAGWIALEAGVAGTADIILLPEIPYRLEKIVEKVEERYREGHGFCILVAAEGAMPVGGGPTVLEKEIGKAEKLGGIGEKLRAEIQALTGRETRCVVLGHLQRGGTPTSYDRLISLRFGAAAVRALAEGQSGVMVALDPPTVRYVPLSEATQRMKVVPLDCDTVLTARELGVSFGD